MYSEYSLKSSYLSSPVSLLGAHLKPTVPGGPTRNGHPVLRRQRRSPHGSRHSIVVQEKLSVDRSATHETIAETNGSENVTYSEFGTLRRIPDSVPFSFSVVAMEIAERFSFYG